MSDESKRDQSEPFAEARGSANLADAVKAAWRLRYYKYYDWSLAGGPNDCAHGVAEGIHCERCDELLLRKTHDQLSSPNNGGQPRAAVGNACATITNKP